MSSVRIRKWTLKLSPKCGEAAGFWGHSPSTPRLPLTSRPRPGDSHSSSHATHHTGAQTAALGAGGLSLQPGNREVHAARRGTLSPPSDTLCPPRPPWCGTSPRAGLGPRRDGRGTRRGQGRTGDNGCAPPAYTDGATNGTRSGASALTGCAGGEPAGTSRWVKAVAGADPVSGACSLEMGTPVSRGVFFFFFWRKGGGLSGPFRDPYRDQRLRGAGSASSAVLPRSAGQRTCEHDSSPGSPRPARGRPLHFGVTVLDDTVTNSGTGKDQR